MAKLAIAAICVFVNVCAWIVWELTKDAVFGWANATIAKKWGVMDLALQESLIANWAPPLLLVVIISLGFWAAYWFGTRAQKVVSAQPFDFHGATVHIYTQPEFHETHRDSLARFSASASLEPSLASTTLFNTAGEKPSFFATEPDPAGSLLLPHKVTPVFFKQVTRGQEYFSGDTFSAMISGLYSLSSTLYLDHQPMGQWHTYEITLLTSNKTYLAQLKFEPNELVVLDISAVADMDAGDTAIVMVKPISAGQARLKPESYFAGWLAA